MARKYRTHVKEEKAVRIIIEIKDLDNYKEAWLIIHNNARDNQETIYKVYNAYGSDKIFILCDPDDRESVKSWLSQYGEITEESETTAVFVDVDCDYTKSFDEDYIDSEYVLGETD